MEYLNVHISLCIFWSLLFPWVVTKSKLISEMTTSTYLHTFVLALFIVFNMTSLLFEAFISLGFKLKPERTVSPLGFSELAVC